MVKVKDFLMPQNKDRVIPNEEQLNTLIGAFNAISRVTYRSMYIIDCLKKKFLYVSNSPFFLYGRAHEIIQGGFPFYIKQIPENEQEMFVKINKAGFDFFYQVPKEERTLYTLSYDFNLLNGKNKMLVNHKITPISINVDGKIQFAACVLLMSSKRNAGNVKMLKTGQTSFWKYSLEGERWEENAGVSLKEKEKMVIFLSAKGFTMDEIAARMHLSIDSIKLYRKKIFDKLGVKCITEALAYAVNNKLM